MPRPAKRFFLAGEDQGLLDDEDGDIDLPMTFGKRPRPATTEGERGRKPSKKPARKAARRPRRGK